MPVREDEATELKPGTEAWRVDAVGGPANGTEWLFLKAEAGEQPLTEVEAAMLASARAGKRIDEIIKSNSTGRQPHDSPTYDALDAVGTAEHAQPNSTINGAGSPSGSGSGDDEVDSILGTLRKEAAVVVGHCDYLNSLALMKAEADYQAWVKGKYTAEQKASMLSAGKAYRNANGDPSYPIGDVEDLGKAIKAVGRGGSSHNGIRKYIMRRAKAMGKSSMIPENWQADGSLAKDAAYLSQPGATLDGQMAPEAGPDLDTEVDVDGSSASTTTGNTPGSPAWEQADADRLIAAGQMLAQVCQCLCDARDSEATEVAAGHFDDQNNVCDLQDAKCAAEYALGIVARLAFHEEVEANTSMIKDGSLTGAAVDAIRQAISLLKSGDLDWLSTKQPAPDGSGTKEEGVFSMGELTKEDLAEVVGGAVKDGVSAGITAAFEKAEADRKERKAAKLAKAEKADPEAKPEAAAADPELAKGEATPEAKSEEAPAPAAEQDIASLVKEGVLEVMSPITERLEKLEAQPQSGGPLVGAAGGGFVPGQGRGTPLSGTPTEVADLQSRIQKAAADGDKITETRLRKDLGNSVLAYAWESRGYPRNAARGQAMQFTENAAAS